MWIRVSGWRSYAVGLKWLSILTFIISEISVFCFMFLIGQQMTILFDSLHSWFYIWFHVWILWFVFYLVLQSLLAQENHHWQEFTLARVSVYDFGDRIWNISIQKSNSLKSFSMSHYNGLIELHIEFCLKFYPDSFLFIQIYLSICNPTAANCLFFRCQYAL